MNISNMALFTSHILALNLQVMILFVELQNEIFRYFVDNKHVLLLGDFNARSGDLSHYTTIDD